MEDIQIRDQKVSIFVPSRYAQGQPIPPDARQYQVRQVADLLAGVFGGASAEEIERKATPIVGTFRHTADTRTGTVDEPVQRVWVAVEPKDLRSTANRDAVIAEACRLRDALRQESVLIEWGKEVIFSPEARHRRVLVSFGRLPKPLQEDFASLAWHRVATPADLFGVFSLGGWSAPAADAEEDPRRSPIARSRPRGGRTVWCWRAAQQPSDHDLRKFPPGDLVVARVPDDHLRFWLRTRKDWAGPRDIPLATAQRPTRRIAVEFVLAALEGAARLPLAAVLDSDATTARFYSDIKALVDRVAQTVPPQLRLHGIGLAQRLLGRLLFVRFVEEKGWLARNGLRDGWDRRAKGYYSDVLLPLFRALDTPPSLRPADLEEAPYLNGGLFALRQEDLGLSLSDDLFDPAGRGPTLLKLLYDYDFTLDETAAKDQVVSVDPAMLGRVLEGLTPDDTKKKKGVHYTPAPIARALALGGLLPQLVRRLRKAGFENTDSADLVRLLEGDASALSVDAIECLNDQLETLRIVDPAVGSGGLLVACLDVMLELAAECERALGGDLRRGSPRWAVRARQFVTQCLYGIDVSPEAIEIGQLRLWLYLAVGEATPTALPELGYNLRVADSLPYDPAESRLVEALARRGAVERGLEFDTIDACVNRALDARQTFISMAKGNPAERAAAFHDLEETERQLRAAIGGGIEKRSGPPPFAWAVHFPEVFQRDNKGFDVVIANPPYVRNARMTVEQKEELRRHYLSMQKNGDLYYAFVERCLSAPLADASQANPQSKPVGLAGRFGSIAFILPSFAQTTSAEGLRSILAEGGHIDRWVDFLDLKVFKTSDTYVALLFASAERRTRSTFTTQIVTPPAFKRMQAGEPWLNDLVTTTTRYTRSGWNVRPASKAAVRNSIPLGDLATIQVGIQTSLDGFFLFDFVNKTDDPKVVLVRSEFDELELEAAALFPCAKGSVHLQADRLKEGCFVLWPYEPGARLMSEASLRKRFPRAWRYLVKYRSRLEAREHSKFKNDGWWRFRRPQGINCATEPKIIVPSIMHEPTAFLDKTGHLICTASGKGGGGGWIIQPRPESGLSLDRLATFLLTEDFRQWLEANAEPKKGGWWGVDRKTIRRCPIPRRLIMKPA